MKFTEKKIGNLATITTGLVVKRKQAALKEEIVETYKMLTLKSFDQYGWLNVNHLDIFESNQILDEKYLTQVGDVVVRLSSPNTAIIIDEEHTGILIPSLFIVIRVKENKVIPEFLSIYLNSNHMKRYYAKTSIGSTIQIVKTSMFKDITIRYPSTQNQEKVIEVNKLINREKKLLEQLLEEKNKYHNAILNKML